MMRAMNANKSGLALAAIFGGWHFLWSTLVAIGWAQTVIDFIFWMHFIKPVYVIGLFNIGTALVLVAVTSVLGYAMGASFGIVWNRLHR